MPATEADLDLVWLRDAWLEDADRLPPPEVPVRVIVDDLEVGVGGVRTRRRVAGEGYRAGERVIIIAGRLHVRADERDAYLVAVAGVAPLARATSGCLDFVQAPDPLDPTRINIYERWEDDEPLLAFRSSGSDADAGSAVPVVLSAEVRTYRVGAVEDP